MDFPCRFRRDIAVLADDPELMQALRPAYGGRLRLEVVRPGRVFPAGG